MKLFRPPVSVTAGRFVPSPWDGGAAAIVLALFVMVAAAAHGMLAPLSALAAAPVSLDPANLPYYALRTTVRMLLALGCSILFTFTYATLAAKSRRAGLILVPILDILQSVPILGFISITITGFMALFPGRVLGAEFAAIFAIFTSQAWNMAFSFYQSLRTLPGDLDEACRSFRLSPWLRFWRAEVPFALPALVWNMMMSMSGGWFFVVASEALTVGHTTITLPGVGSYIALAIRERDMAAVAWAVAAMALVILAYDQLMFRPLVAWADRFRAEQTPGALPAESWVLTMIRRARLIRFIATSTSRILRWLRGRPPVRLPRAPESVGRLLASRAADRIWAVAVAIFAALAVWRIAHYAAATLAIHDVVTAFALGGITFLRVAALIALASAIWVPVGIYVGLRPRLATTVQPAAQFLAAFPANLLFPAAVVGIVQFHLDPDIWLSPLMILGTQWYVLFNVVAGAAAIPGDLRDVAANLGLRGWVRWRKTLLPAVFPYYVTGAITATGGSWNASIVAEVASWGHTRLAAHGIGAYIAHATAAGDHARIVLGIAVMSAFVIVVNRMVWRPLYAYAERRLRLD